MIYPIIANKKNNILRTHHSSYSEEYAQRMCNLYLSDEIHRDDEGKLHKYYRLHVGIIQISESDVERAESDIYKFPGGKTVFRSAAQIIGFPPEAFRHPVFAHICHGELEALVELPVVGMVLNSKISAKWLWYNTGQIFTDSVPAILGE